MTGRPYIRVLFRCCNVYQRVYLNKTRNAYVGHCPTCCRRFSVKVSPIGARDAMWLAD